MHPTTRVLLGLAPVLTMAACSNSNMHARQRSDRPAPDYASISDSAETAWYARQERRNQAGWNNTNNSGNTGNMNYTDSRTGEQVQKPWKSGDVEWVGAGQNDSGLRTADGQILAFLHKKNLEEIDLGRLAQTKSNSDDIRSYGVMMVRDHSSADAQVTQAASNLRLRLPSAGEGEQLPPRQENWSGNRMDGRTNEDNSTYGRGDMPPKSPLQELQALNGDQFDRAFADKMVEGHRKVIERVEAAQSQVQSQQVKQLLSQLLPTLRMHEQHARELQSRFGSNQMPQPMQQQNWQNRPSQDRPSQDRPSQDRPMQDRPSQPEPR